MDLDISAGALMVMFAAMIIGLALIKRGKSEGPFSHIIYGVVLLIYPYFLTDTLPMLLVGAGIMALSYFVTFG